MSAPGSTNALRSATFDNLQLNAGVFIKDLVYSGNGAPANSEDLKTLISGIVAGTITGKGEILGATRGGGTFNVTREMREPEIDGMRYRFKGGTFIDSVDAYLSTTVVEVTPDNFAALLGGTAETLGKITTITMETALDPENDNVYLTNVCWVGDLSDGRLVLICLKNAINTADFTLTFTDKGEGTLAVEFHACQDEVNDYDTAPFEVLFFDKDSGSMGSITVTSSAGSAVGATALSTTNTLGAGEVYVYKVGTATDAPAAQYHAAPDYTWTEWDGSSQINVGASANGKKITVGVLSSGGSFIKSGVATLAVKTT